MNSLTESQGEAQAAIFLSSILNYIVENTPGGEASARECYRGSKLKLLNLLPKEKRTERDLIQFIEQHELNNIIPESYYGSKLKQILSINTTSTDIEKWLEEQQTIGISEGIFKDGSFCGFVLSCAIELLNQKFDCLIPLLQKFSPDSIPNALKHVSNYCASSDHGDVLLSLFQFLQSKLGVPNDSFHDLMKSDEEVFNENVRKWIQSLPRSKRED